MALVFPAAPAVGQIYSPGDGSPSYVYRGSEVWQNVGMGFGYGPVPFTATPGQTTINVAYQVGAVDIFIEGVRLDQSDFTATNGTSIVLADPLLGGESGVVIPHSVLSTLQGLSKSLNLSDLPDIDAALTNLGFGSFGKTLRAAADAAAARSSLGQAWRLLAEYTVPPGSPVQYVDLDLQGCRSARLTAELFLPNGVPSTALSLRTSANGGNSYFSGAGDYRTGILNAVSAAIAGSAFDAAVAQLSASWQASQSTEVPIIGEFQIFAGDASRRFYINGNVFSPGSDVTVTRVVARRNAVGQQTNLRMLLFDNSANIAPGSRFILEGRT